MKFLNVGPLELLFLLILAFIVLGPKRAIQTARDVGQWLRNLAKSPFWREIVNTSTEIRELPKRFMDDAELQKLIEDLDLSTQEVKEILNQTQTETQATLGKLEDQIGLDLNAEPPSSTKPMDKP